MNVLTLAVDTSSLSGSVALLEDGSCLAEDTCVNAGLHAKWLLPSIDGLLKVVGTQIEKIDIFALTIGPGAFTGLRIGISTVKGLARALGKEVSGVSTLAALAMNFKETGMMVCPVLDARKGEVYAAVYSFTDGRISCLMKDASFTPAALISRVRDIAGGPVQFVGGGAALYAEIIKKDLKSAEIAPIDASVVRASNVGLLAYGGDEIIRGAPTLITPVYLRNSDYVTNSRN